MFNFIFNRKNKVKTLGISFLVSVIFFGVGIGLLTMSIKNFTYIDDVIEGICKVMKRVPDHPIVYNIGNNHPEELLDFVKTLQEELVNAKLLPDDYDFAAHCEFLPMQPGDVLITYADTSKLEADVGYRPSTSLRDGLRYFVEWYAAEMSHN